MASLKGCCPAYDAVKYLPLVKDCQPNLENNYAIENNKDDV